MKINKQNLRNNTPTFDDLPIGAIFIGTPNDCSCEGVFMKLEPDTEFTTVDDPTCGLAVDLEDGTLVAFYWCAGVRKVEGTLTLS